MKCVPLFPWESAPPGAQSINPFQFVAASNTAATTTQKRDRKTSSGYQPSGIPCPLSNPTQHNPGVPPSFLPVPTYHLSKKRSRSPSLMFCSAVASSLLLSNLSWPVEISDQLRSASEESRRSGSSLRSTSPPT